MKTQHNAFTLTELLVVIAIIALLVGIAVPALQEGRMKAKMSKEKTTISNLEMAIENFKNDHGFFPESSERQSTRYPIPKTLREEWNAGPLPADQGAHLLVEAMVGLDMLGYQDIHYYKTDSAGVPIAPNPVTSVMEETKRSEPYMDLNNIRIGTMQDAHPGGINFAPGKNYNPVFLDQLEWSEPRAILYYRARKAGTNIWDPSNITNSIYNYYDNEDITEDDDGLDPQVKRVWPFPESEFKEFIWDTKTGIRPNGVADVNWPSARPYNRDSFLLIGAGRDHRYGTEDDITNFDK